MIEPQKPLTADEIAARRQQLAKTLMLTRFQMAWGDEIGAMKVAKVWPSDAKAWRAYPHEPNAEIDMALAQAEAVIATIEQQRQQIENAAYERAGEKLDRAAKDSDHSKVARAAFTIAARFVRELIQPPARDAEKEPQR